MVLVPAVREWVLDLRRRQRAQNRVEHVEVDERPATFPVPLSEQAGVLCGRLVKTAPTEAAVTTRVADTPEPGAIDVRRARRARVLRHLRLTC